MSSPAQSQASLEAQAATPFIPLDEAVWNTWVQKCTRQEREHAASRTKVVKWICVGLLVAAAIVSSEFFTATDSGYQMAIRFAIVLGALAIMLQSLRTKQYVFTGVFVGVMILFNPLLPSFAFSGKSLILVASLLPFAASLIWMKERIQNTPLLIPKAAI